MRTVHVFLVSCLVAQATASDLPAGSVWAADARSGAMARPFWTDSTNWNLFNIAGHTAVLPGIMTSPVQIRLGTSGIGVDNSDVEYSQSEVAALQLRGGIENKAGYILDVGWVEQKAARKDVQAYEAGRLPWGFDVGSAFGPDRAFSLGLGARILMPSNQTQDSSGRMGVAGDFERWQPTIQALRAGIATHFAQSVTLAGKFEASADIDTLLHSDATNGLKSQHRYVLVRSPVISLSAQFDKADLPVQGLADVTFGSTHRMGVMKTEGGTNFGDAQYANVDFPVLVGDSLRILVGAMGRWTRDGHTIRPVLVYERGSLESQMYAPIAGSKDPFEKGEKLADSGWTMSSEGGTMGAFYSWERGLAASLELSSYKRNIQFLDGIERDDESHTDLGMGIGIEASHRLIPVWKEKIPESMEFLVRLGWERKSLAGAEIEKGFLSGMTIGYEESARGYSGGDGPNRGWAGQESKVGMNPLLGAGADLNLVTFGLGATFLERALEINSAFQVGSVTPNSSDELDVFGWRAELRWSH